MYSFIAPSGEIIKTKTIKQFADQYGFRYSNAKSLACGHFLSLRGFISNHARAKKLKARLLTEMVNINTGERCKLGKVTTFAKRQHVSTSHVYRVVNGHELAVRGWALAKTLDVAQTMVPGTNF